MVAKKSLWKDCFREIRKNLSRYLSLMAIVCLGVGFFAGINAASPDMLETADAYFKEYDLMDLRFVSTMGLTDDDVEALRQQPDIKDAEAGYTLDAFSQRPDEEGANVMRIHSLPSAVSRVCLIEGSLPAGRGECVLENSANNKYPLGSQIQLSLPEDDILDSLRTDTYTVVGYVDSPYYISLEKGNSSLGDGSVSSFMMILPEDFTLEVYTDAYATLYSTQDVTFDSDDYKNIIANAKDSIEPFTRERVTARYNEIVEEAQSELDEKKQEYEDGLQEAEQMFADAKKELDNAKSELDSAQKELDRNRSKANKELAEAKQKLDSAKALLDEKEPALQKGLEQFSAAKIELEAQKTQLKDTVVSIDVGLQEIDAYLAIPGANTEELEARKQELTSQKAFCQQAIADIDTGIAAQQAELEQAQVQLAAGRAELEANEGTYNSTRRETLNQLEEAQTKINNGLKEYNNGLAEYNTNYEKTFSELNQAKVKIDEAQQEIDSIERPVWYTMEREDIAGYSTYNDNVGRVAAIAVVFPAFFMLIAVLVCLTSMTRMVEDNRTQIGTYKACGYSNAAISLKYILYSASATLIGGLIGLVIGFKVFPTIIFNAYKILYIMPEINAPFRWGSGITVILLSLVVILLSTISVCYKELQEVPSQLMRPKSPKVGKKVLLERIAFLWNRLTFIHKVTVRNLFRYKKRMLMTVIGIAGCTALMLCGFGIRDSISTIGDKQFGEIFKEDMIVALEDEPDAREAFEKDTVNIRNIERQLFIYSANIKAKNENGSVDATLMVPETPDEISYYINLPSTTDESAVPLDDSGFIITRKAAELLGVQAGDTITLENKDLKQFTGVVSAVCVNYVNHYIYMTPSYYYQISGNTPESNQVLVNAAEKDTDAMDDTASEILKSPQVLGVSKLHGIGAQFSDTMSSLNIVVFVLIICAGILAFVVLFNLVSVNITERTREIATLKVLGFYDKEVTAYLYRENIILTLIGIAAGLFTGVFFHHFVMNTVEIDMVTFSRDIFLSSFIFASLLTILFSVVVNIFTHFKLKKIDMIESLKSVE